MSFKSIVAFASVLAVLSAAPACADSTARDSQGSAHASAASTVVGAGSLEVLGGSGRLVVTSVEMAGDSVAVMMRGAAEGAEVSLQLSAAVAGAASLTVGTSVQVAAESTGYLLTAAGKLVAFIPTDVGRSLLHHSRYQRGN